jgi:outer membrane receptor protein involved in Fe transport
MGIVKNCLCLKRIIIFYCIITADCFAEVSEDPVSLSYGSGEMQAMGNMPSIALGHPVPKNLSPSVTSIITSKDIENIGARRLTDVIEYLPGIHVGSVRNGLNVIGFRGISSEANSQVLVLVNGVPLRNNLLGGKPFVWNMPVKNISHIEVIRGSGSMLYGGDAMTGVINIILKTGKQLKGGDIGGFFGNYDTYEGWAEYGNKQGDWEYSLSMQGGTTDGFKGKLNADIQTALDRQFGTNVSKAPGFTNNGRDDLDFRFDAAYKDWARLRAGYQLFNRVQPGEGALALDDGTGYNDSHVINLDLKLNGEITNDLTDDVTFYYLGQQQKNQGNVLPPGTFGGGLYRWVLSKSLMPSSTRSG